VNDVAVLWPPNRSPILIVALIVVAAFG